MPPIRNPTKRIPSQFHDSQDEAWEKATQLPDKTITSDPKHILTDGTKSKKSKKNPQKATGWQQVWNAAKSFPSKFEPAQGKVWTRLNATTNKEGGELTRQEDSEDDDYDAAKPLVDILQVWMEALVKNCLCKVLNTEVEVEKDDHHKGQKTVENATMTSLDLNTSIDLKSSNYSKQVCKADRASKGPKSTKENVEDSDSGSRADSGFPDQRFGSFLHPPSRPLSPIFSSRSIVFGDCAYRPTSDSPSPPSASSGSSSMFQRCKPVPREEASKAWGLGESWYGVKNEDANEEWEMLEGADVEGDWDLVHEAEKFKIKEDSVKKGLTSR